MAFSQVIKEILAIGHTGADFWQGLLAVSINFKTIEMRNSYGKTSGHRSRGNAILTESTSDRRNTACKYPVKAEQIAKIEKLDHQIVVTHGNGP